MRYSLLAVFFCASLLLAQTPNSTYPSPRLTSLYPCGGQCGQTFEVTIRGSDIDDPTSLRFSHPGIKAEIIAAPVKKDGDKAAKKTAPTDAKFRISIAKDVPAGIHEVRFVGRWGISNPRAFAVDMRSEVNESEPNNDLQIAQRVELGTIVNGVIDSQTDVDYVKFTGKSGQRVFIHCAAGSIDSRAKPLIECFGGNGRERIAFNSGYSGTDALCDVTLPGDGEYFLRISEFAYTAGGSDYFYRLTVGTGEWLDAIFPPMVQPGRADIRLVGRPFGIKTASIVAPDNNFRFNGLLNLPQASGLSDGFATSPEHLNSRPVYFAAAPVILESEGDNNVPAKAQAVPMPCDIAGTISVRNDVDCYRFTAKKNEPVMVELSMERIGTSLDGVLTIRGPDGKEIAGESTLDDDPETLHPTSFFNRTTDPPPFKLVPAVDGEYSVTVSARDAHVNFGPRAIYRLRISPPKPDFRVVVMPRNRDIPSGVTVTPGGETALDVFLQRLDGFSSSINLSVDGLPKGVSAKPGIIGTGQKWGLIVLSGTSDLKSAETEVTVTATANIEGKEVSRTARSASIIWNVPNANNSPTIARLDHGMVVATRPSEKTPYRLAINLAKAVIKSADGKERAASKLNVRPGEKLSVPVSVIWQADGARPNVINIATEPTFSTQGQSAISANGNNVIPIPKDKNEITITIDVRQNLAPGLYSVMLRGDTKTQMISDPMNKTKKEYTVLAFADPFTVKVLPLTLGKLTAQVTSPIKVGQSGIMTVKVERAYEFSGPFPLTVRFPEGCGLSTSKVSIPAGENEVKVTIHASKDAKPGNVQIAIESVAVYDGDDVPHKLQTNLSITK